MALALFAPAVLVACSSDDGTDEADAGSEQAGPDEGTTTSSAVSSTASAAQTDDGTDADAESPAAGDLRWARTNLGFVSAYVVARGNSAAIVDTGVEGSAEAIGQTLADLGLTYNDVESVILTHHHGDHAGSIGEVLDMAVNATAWAGEADLASISADVSPLLGGEDVFGMEMLATPGHTAGHMAAIDHGAGLLIAGDALTVDVGAAAAPPAQFTADMAGAQDSIRLLAELSFNTLLVGHGDPIESGADASVASLADSF